MNRIRAILSKALLLAMPLGAVVVATPGEAEAQITVIAPRPPSVYIATARPEYYGGHANYYYGNQWYYRDGHNWNYYRSEPAYLHERRGHVVVNNRYHYHR
jgi:hypothetical protein